jgi:hypothetical protein
MQLLEETLLEPETSLEESEQTEIELCEYIGKEDKSSPAPAAKPELSALSWDVRCKRLCKA